MKKNKSGRPMQPRKKAEAQDGDIWAHRASEFLKLAVQNKGWGYEELSAALALRLGVEMSSATLNRRINRGHFSAGFLLMCKEALLVELGEETAKQSDTQQPIRPSAAKAASAIMSQWGTKS